MTHSPIAARPRAPPQCGMARVLFAFDTPGVAAAWFAVDDRVMGGASQSGLCDAGGFAVFAGDVSLADGGGFASVRSRPADLGDAAATAFVLEVKGDGRRYKLALHVDDAFDGMPYQAPFDAPAEEWGEVRLALGDFRATFRGRPQAGAPPLDPSRVRQAGLVIGDRQAGPFALAVRCLRAV